MSTLKAKQDQIRQQLNLKNLQRHDPQISEIVTSASYASIYENYGEQWVKTGVEGPMFLFSRSQAPHYGFFVLNRQGLEYIQEFLTPDCELSVGGEFILFESGQNVEKATGIWIFDEKERSSLCKRMEQLRAAASAVASSAKSTPAPKVTAPQPVAGQSVSLDMLFGTSTTNSSTTEPSPPPQTVPPTNSQPVPTNPLDLLFLNAAAKNSPQPQARQPPNSSSNNPVQSQSTTVPTASNASAPPSAIPKTLEQLFAAASPVPQSATLPFQALSQAHLSAPSPSLLPNTLPKNTGSNGVGQVNGKEENRGMSLLDSIFASAKTNGSSKPPSPAQAQPPRSPLPTSIPSPLSAPTFQVPPPPAAAPTSQPSSSSADARALLAMLGHPAGLESAASPSTQSPSQPSTTLHPAPFRMDEAPISTTNTEESTNMSTFPKVDEPKKAEGESKPFFAPPLLSHDVFANFPLPSQKVKTPPVSEQKDTKSVEEDKEPVKPEEEEEKRKEEEVRKIKEEEEAVSRALSQVQESVTDILKSAPEPLPSLAPSQSALEEDVKRSTKSSAPQVKLSKSQAVDLVDSVAVKEGLDGEHSEEETLEREQFMQQLYEILKKPSVQMQLYGKYLERVEESQ
ncbi:hypothetical protein JCM5350_000448 [Sporobolomyces pararoseus]